MIVNLASKKVENNENSSPQLTRLHHSLLISIFGTPEKDLLNVEKIRNERSAYIFIKFVINIIFLLNICNV